MDQDYISRLQGAIDGLQNIITERLESMSEIGIVEKNPGHYNSLKDDITRLRGKIEGIKMAREFYTGH